MGDLTPYDTGTRLEPQLWVRQDQIDSAANHADWLPDFDEFGKVDFDNEEGATILTVYVEKSPHGYIMHAETFGPDTVGLMWNKAT